MRGPRPLVRRDVILFSFPWDVDPVLALERWWQTAPLLVSASGWRQVGPTSFHATSVTCSHPEQVRRHPGRNVIMHMHHYGLVQHHEVPETRCRCRPERGMETHIHTGCRTPVSVYERVDQKFKNPYLSWTHVLAIMPLSHTFVAGTMLCACLR